MQKYEFEIIKDDSMFKLWGKAFAECLRSRIEDFIILTIEEFSEGWDEDEHYLTEVHLDFGLTLIREHNFCVKSLDNTIKVFGVTVTPDYSFFIEDLNRLQITIFFG